MKDGDLSEALLEANISGELVGEFMLHSVDHNQFWINGDLKGTQKLECSRTLEHFLHPFNVELKVLVERNDSIQGQEFDNDDEEIYRYKVSSKETELDISECIREQVLLEQPMNPIKNSEEDFNSGSDEKPEESTDSRWDALKELKNKFNDRS